MIGRHTLVLSDHKPLALITGNTSVLIPQGSSKCCLRLQHFRFEIYYMLLRLQHFSFEVHYRKGNSTVLTNHLRRNVIYGTESNEIAPSLTCVIIATISRKLNVSCIRLKRVHKATACDWNMQALTHIIIQGWTDTLGETPTQRYLC